MKRLGVAGHNLFSQTGLDYDDPIAVLGLDLIERGRAEERAKTEKLLAQERARAEQERISHAKAMKSKGYQDIAEIMGLSLAEVQAL